MFLQISQNSQENTCARVYNIHNMNILNVISVFRLPIFLLCFIWNRISVSKLLHYSYSKPDHRKFLYLFRAGETGGGKGGREGGHGPPPTFFQNKKKINNNNRNKDTYYNTLNWPMYLLLFKFYLIFTICLRVQSTCFLQLLLLSNSIILFV